MENKKTNPFKDFVYLAGLALVALSFTLYLITGNYIQTDENNFLNYFWIHYVISGLYFLILLVNGLIKFKWAIIKADIHNTFLYLILCMISCFALNREITIFYDSTTWLNYALVILAINVILTPFRNKFYIWMDVLYFFILGIGSIICLYFTLNLFPYYGIGIAGFLFLGISLHVFIPLIVVIYLSIYSIKNFSGNKHIAISFCASIILSISFIIYFVIKWNNATNVIAYEYNKTILNGDNIYPAWMRVSQHLGDDWITERVLKSELYYAIPRNNNGEFWEIPSRRGLAVVKVHDPLVMTAAFFSKKPDITIDDRIKIIETAYGARHLAQERLWSGESLFTKNIITDVKFFPKLRIAYTEKIISIENKKVKNGWREETQEAIYTFSIPQGAVVTSLSLWINGVEEKGHLTTKAKADTAYKTIVGVLRRDPSVVHWQEGNTVSVRVFPCSPQENRKFKIGITSPLEFENEKLVYKNIKFEGPYSNDATETINLRFADKPQGLKLPFNFEKTDDTNFIWEGSYQEDWKIEFPIAKIPDNHFSFDGNNYSISEYIKEYEPFIAKNIYLDINKAWTLKEFETVWKKVKNKNVLVFQNKMIKLDEENKEEWFERLSKSN
ncbi:MAG TPA: XrtN system VIT domain-containing protein, partial [Cytophagaceae bacterium]|nr:XrtN system VIT domain-containing protein [Cytophagaceae bacterium]